VLASQLFKPAYGGIVDDHKPPYLRVKCRNPHGIRYAKVYYAPHTSFEWLQRSFWIPKTEGFDITTCMNTIKVRMLVVRSVGGMVCSPGDVVDIPELLLPIWLKHKFCEKYTEAKKPEAKAVPKPEAKPMEKAVLPVAHKAVKE
jgi:hypothetical protein